MIRLWLVALLAIAGAGARAESLALSMGGALVCATEAGQVHCWGTATNGGLGSATVVSSELPRTIASITTAVDVAVGRQHACALLAGGSVQCWGDGQAGQLGNGANPVAQAAPVAVTALAGPVIAIALSNVSSCALIQGGAVQCFGSDFRGQLGNDTGINNTNVPGNVVGISTAIALNAGATHFCAVLADGSARCWGDNSSGQLGDNSLTDRQVPVAVAGLSGVQGISGGEFHTCATTATGLKCWGSNLLGQLGTGGFVSSLVPVNSTAVGAASIVRLAAGGRHNCALLGNGTTSCWGRNFEGQLGQPGNSIFSTVGLTLQGLPAVPTALVAGNATTCVRISASDIRCVGSGSFGQLGDARVRRWKAPVAALFPLAAELQMGGQHTCARSDSSLQCLGFNGAGALGEGSNTRRLQLTDVIGSSGVGSALAASETQTCNFVAASNNSQCFGRNDSAQLGTAAATVQETTAVNAPLTGSGRQYLQIALGTFFGCALLAENDGNDSVKRVRCWGRNDVGQLGDGTTTAGVAPTASALANLVEPIAVSAGELHACALEAGGTVKCWGGNGSGQLGRGVSGTVPSAPAAVLGITTAVELVVGRDGRHSCARLADSTVMCWGAGIFGQVGITTPASSVPTPAPVVGLTDAVRLIAGSTHSCALLSTQAVKCWGSNQFDQLGAPGLPSNPTPTNVSGLTSGVLDIVGGALHSCARLAAGWKCWGYNAHGELGNGLAGAALSPVRVAAIGTIFISDFE